MKIEAEWMRGGTSKCWVFEAGHLNDSTSLDSLLPRVFGSPDSRQIDGVGGATSTTSKAMILHRPAEEDIDVDFTFAQVGIEEAAVDWGSNCGNCSAVVGLYAIEKGWVVPSGDVTRIVTRNTNTGQIIVQRVATPAGALPIVPDAQMPGVPFPGYRVGLGFQDPAGKTTGALLPSGSTTDTITAGGTRWTVSMVDAGAPVVIVRAEDLGGVDLARQQQVLGQLLRDRGGAARQPELPDGLVDRLPDLGGGEAAMRKEARVLGHHDGALQRHGHATVRHPRPLHAPRSPGLALEDPVSVDEGGAGGRAGGEAGHARPSDRFPGHEGERRYHGHAHHARPESRGRGALGGARRHPAAVRPVR